MPTTCQQVRRCQRCGAQERHLAEHIWDVWEDEGPTTCDQVRFCRHWWDAGTEAGRQRATEHEWSDWTPVGT